MRAIIAICGINREPVMQQDEVFQDNHYVTLSLHRLGEKFTDHLGAFRPVPGYRSECVDADFNIGDTPPIWSEPIRNQLHQTRHLEQVEVLKRPDDVDTFERDMISAYGVAPYWERLGEVLRSDDSVWLKMERVG